MITIQNLKKQIEKNNKALNLKVDTLNNTIKEKDDKYIDVVNDMYEDGVLGDDEIKKLNLNKEKDVFEKQTKTSIYISLEINRLIFLIQKGV